MRNSQTIFDLTKIKGHLSTDVSDSDFFKFYTDREMVGGYLGSPDRTEFRDKAMETYLRVKGLQDNGVALILSSKDGSKMMGLINEASTPKEFVDLMRNTFDNPMKTIWEIIYQSGITAVSPLKNPPSEKNKEEMEEAIHLYIRMKRDGVKPPKEPKTVRDAYSWEGRYENTTAGHDKFWEISANANGLFTARWGRNGKAPQGTKDDYTYSEAEKLVREKTAKGYEQV